MTKFQEFMLAWVFGYTLSMQIVGILKLFN